MTIRTSLPTHYWRAMNAATGRDTGSTGDPTADIVGLFSAANEKLRAMFTPEEWAEMQAISSEANDWDYE